MGGSRTAPTNNLPPDTGNKCSKGAIPFPQYPIPPIFLIRENSCNSWAKRLGYH